MKPKIKRLKQPLFNNTMNNGIDTLKRVMNDVCMAIIRDNYEIT